MICVMRYLTKTRVGVPILSLILGMLLTGSTFINSSEAENSIPVIVVGIHNSDLRAMGDIPWPVSRDVHLQLASRIARLNPKCVFYAVAFEGQLDRESDIRLLDFASKSKNFAWLRAPGQGMFLGRPWSTVHGVEFLGAGDKQTGSESWKVFATDEETQLVSGAAWIAQSISGRQIASNSFVIVERGASPEVLTMTEVLNADSPRVASMIRDKVVIVTRLEPEEVIKGQLVGASFPLLTFWGAGKFANQK